MKDIASSEKEIILEYLKRQEYTMANDPTLLEMLGNCSSRKLLRLLNYLADDEGVLEKSTQHRRYRYRLKDKAYIVETLSKKEALDLQYALEFSSEGFNQESLKLIKRIFDANSDVIDGHFSSFEDLKNLQIVFNYNTLLDIIKNRFYTRLIFKPNTIYEECKCVKIVFLDNNWYVGFEYLDREEKSKKFKLGRLAFLRNIELLKEKKYSKKNRFQKKEIISYLEFLKNIQNSLTLYGVKPKKVTIKALPEIAHYFDEGMKKFLSSQTFIEKLEDGSMLFTLTYTQPLEILPFIQKWIPYLVPENGEIKKALFENVQTYFSEEPVK